MKNKKCYKITERGSKTVRDGMVKMFVARAIRENRRVSRSRETATARDILTIVSLCIWAGTFPFADMLFLFLSLRYLAGRGGEVGRIPRSSVTPTSVAEWDDQDEKTHNVWFWRVKTSDPQDVPIFTHKNELCMDWPFAHAYSMVMNDNPNEFLFPTFADASMDDEVDDEEMDGEEETDPKELESRRSKKITQHFNAIITRLVKLCETLTDSSESSAGLENNLMEAALGGADEEEDYDEEAQGPAAAEGNEEDAPLRLSFNPRISSHSNKRNAVETANAHPLIQTTWLCMMAGWIMKAVHTVFDYLNRNRSTDEQVALVWAGWNLPGYLGRIGGGHPPMIRALSRHAESGKVTTLISILFVRYVENEELFPQGFERAERFELLEMAMAAILLRLRAFLNPLLEHPQKLFGSANDFPNDEMQRFAKAFHEHAFLRKLRAAASSAEISLETLFEWSDIIEKDFLRRNFMFAAWSDIVRVHGESEFTTDPRNDQRTLGQFMHAIITQNNDSRNQANQDHLLMVSMQQQMVSMQQRMVSMQQQLSRIEIAVTGEHGAAEPAGATEHTSRRPRIDMLVAFPRSLDRLDTKSTFYNWFVDGYYLAIGTDQVGSRRDVSSTIKFAIEYYTLFLKEHVEELPSGVPRGNLPEAAAWRARILKAIDEAWKDIVVFFVSDRGLKAPTTLSYFKAQMYNIDASEWPQGPTGESHFQPSEGPRMKSRADLVDNQSKQRAASRRRVRMRTEVDHGSEDMDVEGSVGQGHATADV